MDKKNLQKIDTGRFISLFRRTSIFKRADDLRVVMDGPKAFLTDKIICIELNSSITKDKRYNKKEAFDNMLPQEVSQVCSFNNPIPLEEFWGQKVYDFKLHPGNVPSVHIDFEELGMIKAFDIGLLREIEHHLKGYKRQDKLTVWVGNSYTDAITITKGEEETEVLAVLMPMRL